MNPVDPRDPSRNLLFGLLAFQNNFIDRRALLAAFDAWMADKSQPLGRVLADQGAISGDLLALIDGLVSAHLARHDNEPEKSLAALTPIGSVRKDLESLADPEARASLSQLSLAPSNFDPFATNFESVGDTTSAGTRFRILRPLNKGGMGVVSVALDTELDRSIALKEIRDTAAHDAGYRARFLAEAEITGKLEHPGIIPIYGLGTYADGRPFYAMRLIRGDKTGSLMDAIARFYKEPDPAGRVVEFRGLLRRFLDVCNALSYAHSKGVLHRDLKPDNILLGPYGETLVVDWGLAKAAGRADPVAPADGDHVRLNLSGSELSPTMAGGAMGTPGYAPPEQMTGDLPNIGPRSDVYGLGAVLYCLMTGQAPFSRKGLDLGKLIQKIDAGDFPPPREIRAEADKPLEAICLKAMSKKPGDRYESVAVLAAELERYLADEPVTAFREPWTIRARRWARKHRTAVTSVAATLVVAVAALLIGLFVVGGLNRRLDRANKALGTALDTAKEARSLAEARKTIADENFTLALDAVKEQVFDITRQLENRAGTRDLRARLQRSATERLKTLTERASRRADADRIAAAAHSNLGDVYLRVDLKPSLARVEFRKAIDLTKQFVDTNPPDASSQRDLTVGYVKLGDVELQMGQTAKAKEYYELGLAIAKRLADSEPIDPHARHPMSLHDDDLSVLYTSLGDVSRRMGESVKAVEYYELSLDHDKRLAGAQGSRRLSASHDRLGDLAAEAGAPAKALEHYTLALDLRKVLVAADPRNILDGRSLSVSYNKLGDVAFAAGQTAKSLEYYELGMKPRKAAADADPTDAQARRDLTVSYDKLGKVALQSGRPAQSVEYYKLSMDLRKAAADADPADAQARRDLSLSYAKFGDITNEAGQAAKALEYYTLWHEIAKSLAEADPGDTVARRDLSLSYERLGAVMLRLGEPAKAMECYQREHENRERLAREHPTDSNYAGEMAGSLNHMAAVDFEENRLDAARDHLKKAIVEQWKALAANPNHPTHRQYLGGYLSNLILANKGLGDAEGVAEAESELARLRDSDPAMVALDSRLSSIIKVAQQPKDNAERLKLAQRAYDKALHTTAARLWAEALAADPKLGDDRQAGHRYNAACAAALAGSGQGKDDPKPDEAAKAKLRGQAQTLLKAELSAWKRVAMTIGPGNKELVAKTLTHWKEDADLANVREASTLDKLPEAERKEWRTLWADVDALLEKTHR